MNNFFCGHHLLADIAQNRCLNSMCCFKFVADVADACFFQTSGTIYVRLFSVGTDLSLVARSKLPVALGISVS